MDYMIKFGDEILPNKYLMQDGYISVPNQRTELDAYRDADVLLHRSTSPNYKSKIQLTLCPMNEDDKRNVKNIIKSGMVNEVERKVYVTYWNEEFDAYTSGFFYIADVSYQPMGMYGGELWYNSVELELTEY